jgi:hypothetical protein
MVQTCTQCSRANPPEAVYCYFDGFVLGDHARRGGPVAVGSQPFAHPFVFPTGRACRSFDELALACQEEWPAACDLLRHGHLARFFAALGRPDLARAAGEAASFPDADRGLDLLLGKLPGGALADPRLRVEPLEVNLGILAVGEDRSFDLHLENQGMRLLYGSVSCDGAGWLLLGEGDGSPEKHFQFTHESAVRVRVRGDRLRASHRLLEGKLLVESNGGTFTSLVRAEVPVQPFPTGVLAGAASPRQVAEKCQARPREAAAHFESGEVQRWYAANGWTYPVKVPAASGLAAVQQFFEALGVTRPPRVVLDQREVALTGEVGARLEHALEVRSPEKRPIYAHAASDQPWLEVGRPRPNGRHVAIPFTVPAVPDRPGQTLTARVTVRANGNQRFVVPVTLRVAGGDFLFTPAPPAESPAPALRAPTRARRAPRGFPAWAHALPAALLAAAVLAVVAADLWDGSRRGADEAGVVPRGWVYDPHQLADPRPRLAPQFSDESRFGLVMRDQADPDHPQKGKLLTADNQGQSNNTVVRIGGYDYRFGYVTPSNRWLRGAPDAEPLPQGRLGRVSTMQFRNEQVEVRQHVEVVPGQAGLLDTCLLAYTVRNYGSAPHKVGLRVMLDTYIGNNDGVPFTVPGRSGFVTTREDFDGESIPDYIEAVERPDDPADPGTTARISLRGLRLPGVELEQPQRLRICRYPGNRNVGWDWEPEDMKGDSCVAVYWAEREMDPGEERHLAFTYGLSKLEVGDLLALSVPNSVLPGAGFVATVYVYNPRPGQKVTLGLPAGLEFAPGEAAEKVVEGGGARTQVFWKLRAGKEGTYSLKASSGKAQTTKPVVVKGTSIFG